MERLTEKQSAGYDLKALNGEWCNHYCHKQRVETCNECGIYQAIQKLAEYENVYKETGLTPEECVDVVHRYRNICEWLTLYDIQHIEEIAKIVRAFKEGKLLYNY